MDLNINPKDLINAKERLSPAPKLEPKIDMLISRVVGKKIYQRDPRLMKLIIKWKQNKPADSMEPDNFLKNPEKVKELKKVLNTSL